MSPCNTCVGYGVWAVGDAVPMYPLDAEDGMPSQPCPECGANGFDFREALRLRRLHMTDAQYEKKQEKELEQLVDKFLRA